MLSSFTQKTLKTPVKSSLLLTVLLLLSPTAHADIYVGENTYAAIAYSPETGACSYTWDHNSRCEAEQAALALRPEKDARIVGWVRRGWLVLAIGDNKAHGIAWEFGDGASSGVAAKRAMDNCRKNGGKVTKLVIVCSGDVDPQIIETTSTTQAAR